MNQYDFKEFRILRGPNRGKHGNLTMMIELQEIDAPLALELYYRDCWQHGVMLKAEVSEMESEVPVQPKTSDLIDKKSASIYQEFKWFCERNGKDYEKEKLKIFDTYPEIIRLGFKNMKDLENYHEPEIIKSKLENRMAEIKEELGFYSETN